MSSSSSKSLNSRQRVLKAATALFAARGFHQTSTRDVARRARVNEITVFRLFKSKRELYLEVLESNVQPVAQGWLPPKPQSSDDTETAFLTVAERLQTLFEPTLLRLLFYAALEQPELLRKHYRAYLTAFDEALEGQIQSGIDKNVLRRLEPSLMGHALMGIIAYHHIVDQFLPGLEHGSPRPKECTKALADIWLHGTRASGFQAHDRRKDFAS